MASKSSKRARVDALKAPAADDVGSASASAATATSASPLQAVPTSSSSSSAVAGTTTKERAPSGNTKPGGLTHRSVRLCLPRRRRDTKPRELDGGVGGGGGSGAAAVHEDDDELDGAARRSCIEQLRREKDYAVRQVRDEEQARSTLALKDLTTRLTCEHQRQLDEARETQRLRHEAELSKVARQHEISVRRLKDDLERCQNQLREEIEKRGVSSSVRAGFDAERARLIQKVTDLTGAKRRLEDALQSAADTEKQKALELRRTQEACKQELARVSKDANAEIRKLLEELKAKDHQLALLDRSQYPDRGASLGKHIHSTDGVVQQLAKDEQAGVDVRQGSAVKQSTRPLPPAQPPPPSPPSSSATSADGHLEETVRCLKADIDQLTGQLAASETDRALLKSQINELRDLLTDRDKIITDLRSTDQGKDKSIAVIVASSQEPRQGILTTKCQPKAVRFLLPGSTLPVLAREIPTCTTDEDETDSISSEVSDICSLSPTASPIMSPDSTIFCDESIEKNYHLLLTEHLQLQRSVALILSSWTSSSASSAVALDKQVTCSQDCSLKMESLKVAIDTLKDKISMCEEVEYTLRQQLKDQLEQNEELEFRLFELEECIEKCKTSHHDVVPAHDDSVVEPLKKKLALYEALEIELALPSSDGLPLRDFIVTLRQQRNDLENQLNICKSVMETLQEQQLRCHCKHSSTILPPPPSQPLPLEIMIDSVVEVAAAIQNKKLEKSDAKGLLPMAEPETEDIVSTDPSTPSYWLVEPSMTTASDIQDFLNIEDEDDDKLCSVMMCSISSATSGFDDNSCASSVADDTRLDDEEIPAEELMNWEVDVVDELRNDVVEVESSSAPQTNLKTSTDGDELETGACRLSSASENSVTTPTTRDDDTLSRTDEQWIRRLEKLERRLIQALEGEQRARDQLALMGEEKDRRITALEDQVDLLEANEFRLSKTIDTLEQLERAFRCHFLNSTAIASDCTATLMKLEDDTKLSAADMKQQQLLGVFVSENVSEKNSSCLEQMMSLVKEDGNDDGCLKGSNVAADDIGHPCNIEGCAQCHACRTLKNTIDQLQIAQREHAAFDRRIRELECPETVSPEDFDTTSPTTPQVVDFEAEYRELEILVRELRKVLIVERQEEAISDTSSQRNDHSEGSSTSCAQASGRCSTMSPLSVESQNLWQFEDDTFSLPATPILELDNASLLVLNERNRELEITEQYLQQQICDLETERRQLHEVIHNNETTIHDLDVQVLELQGSEDSLKQDISRLRAKDDWMNRRIDDLMELVGRLEDTVKCHQTTESELRSRLERHQTTEADLGRELENSMEETRATESKYRRWISQLEDEKDALLSKLDDLLDRNMELESREAALACRLRKMEVVELGLRGEISELEHTLAHRMGEICEEKLITIDGDQFSSAAETPEKPCRCHRGERRAEMCRLKETVTFLQQSLQASRRSNVGLEAKLKEHISGEQMLRGTISEYEKIDQIWQETVSKLENSNKELTEKVSQLERQLNDVQHRYSVDMLTSPLDQKDSSLTTADDEVLRRWSDDAGEDETASNAQGKRTVEQSIEAILKGILLLNDAADHADHTELTYWAAVEGVACDAGNDAVTAVDDVVTSPYWADVEAHMGLDSESTKDYTITETTTTATTTAKPNLASSVAVRSTKSTTDEVDTVCVSSNSSTMAMRATTLPPPLPLSPPPPDSKSHISSSLLSLNDYHMATGSESASEVGNHEQSLCQGEGAQYHASVAVIDSLQKVSSSNVDAAAPAVNRKLTVVHHAADKVQQTPPAQQDTITSAEGVAARESMKERSNKARQFWTEMSDNQGVTNTTATTCHKVPPPVPDRPSSFRPTLIPRGAFVKQFSAGGSSGEDKGNVSPLSPAIATMPVIKPATMTLGVAVERSAADQSGRPDKRARSPVYTTVLTSNRSYIPKLVSGNGGGGVVSPNADEKPCSLTPTQDGSSLPNNQPSEPTTSKSSYPFVLLTSSSKLRSAESSVGSTSQHRQHPATAAAGSMTCNNPELSPSSGMAAASPGRRD